MNTICKDGITIYPNGTGCTNLIYVTMEESGSETTQTLPTILTVLVILGIAGIFIVIYKKFFQK